MRRESWKHLKKILEAVYVWVVCLVSRATWCIIFWAWMDCIHIITNAYNNFWREINSSALIFVEVYFDHLLFNVYDAFNKY